MPSPVLKSGNSPEFPKIKISARGAKRIKDGPERLRMLTLADAMTNLAEIKRRLLNYERRLLN